MRYRVRNEHGELKFESFEELREAYRNSLVDPDDDVIEEGATTWRKASSIPKLAAARETTPSLMQGEGRWYLIAAAVLIVGVGLLASLRKGYLGILIVLVVAMFSTSFFVWSTTRRRRR